jgi:hypothetical protein
MILIAKFFNSVFFSDGISLSFEYSHLSQTKANFEISICHEVDEIISEFVSLVDNGIIFCSSR